MSNAPEQRKLAAITFTDIAGYSALSQRDDKLALELLEEHRELIREIFPRFNGTEIKTIGEAHITSYGVLKLMPFWDPLRGDPRFEKIVASLAPKEK